MKIIFMGTPDFSVGTLEALIKAGHEIVLTVTQPDKPKGRGNVVQFPPVKKAAVAHHLPVYQPGKIREKECIEYLRGYEADLVVVVAFGQILPKELLDMPKYGCINVHASLLPKYRGAAPIQWAVINGEETTGVTTMKMDEGLDTGDIIMSVEVPVAQKETGGSLFGKLEKAGAQLCVETLRAIEEHTAVFTPQDHSRATMTKVIRKNLGKIDFSKPAVEIERLVRGLNPWPSAYTILDGKMLKIWEADVKPEEDAAAGLEVSHGKNAAGGLEISAGKDTAAVPEVPQGKDAAAGLEASAGKDAAAVSDVFSKENAPQVGTVLAVDGTGIFVQTGDGVLVLKEVQLAGRKRMAADAFLRGAKVPPGTRLG